MCSRAGVQQLYVRLTAGPKIAVLLFNLLGTGDRNSPLASTAYYQVHHQYLKVL